MPQKDKPANHLNFQNLNPQNSLSTHMISLHCKVYYIVTYKVHIIRICRTWFLDIRISTSLVVNHTFNVPVDIGTQNFS